MGLQIQLLDSNFTHLKIFGKNSNQIKQGVMR